MIGEGAHDLAYRISWRTSGVRTGTHRGRFAGTGGLFKDLAPLIDEPDPRRIDIRASAFDPFERLLVRRAERPAAIAVNVLVDVSASMGFAGRCNKMAMSAAIADALATCARRAGDAFGLSAFDTELRNDLSLEGGRSRAAHGEVIGRLAVFRPERPGIAGIAAAAARLPRTRGLVFLISDFLWTAEDGARAADLLSGHDVVPVVIEDTAALEDLPEFGLLTLDDMESGGRRLVLMRPALKARWRADAESRRLATLDALSHVSRPPFHIRNVLDWQRFGSYLMNGAE